MPLDFFWQVSSPLYPVPSSLPPDRPCCRFSLGNCDSSRRNSVLMLLSLSSVTNWSLLFGFCAACMLSYRCLQMEWWAAVTVAAIPLQPALLTHSVTVCFIRQTVSAFTSGLSHYSAQLTPCWLHLVYFGQKTGCWRISRACHRHPHLLRCHRIFLSIRSFPSINLPASCLSMKSATHVPVERLVDASPFFLLLIRKLCWYVYVV